MRFHGLVIAILGLVAGVVYATGEKDLTKDDKKILQGVWKPVSAEMGGMVATEESIRKMSKLGIEGDRLTTPRVERTKAIYDGPLDIDASGPVKRITLHGDGPDGRLAFHGIYKVEGHELTICLNTDGTIQAKPSEFDAKKGSPFCVIKFQREKK